LKAKYSTNGVGLDGTNGGLKRPHSSSSKLERFYLNTQLDEKGQATGLPLAGMLVLRNMARQMLKLDEHHANHGPRHQHGRSMTLMERHFGQHQEKMFHVMTYNYSLRAFAPEFLYYVGKGLLDKGLLEANGAKRVRLEGEFEL
jgi:hypothetical protein